MKKTNNILIGLDLSNMDDLLLSFARYFGKALHSQRAVGAHIIPALLVGDAIKVDANHILRPIAPAVGRIEDEVAKKTKKWMAPTGIKYETNVLEGKPYPEMMNLLSENATDLLIIGKKEKRSSQRITTRKIARKTQCDLLIIPEGSLPHVEKIIVAVDLSEKSANALEKARYLQDQFETKPTVECVLVEDNPFFKREAKGDSNSMRFDELSKARMEQVSAFKTTYSQWCENVKFTFLDNPLDNVAYTLQEYAVQTNADLVVMGAKGKNLTERLLFGTVAENMVKDYFATPVYIVR